MLMKLSTGKQAGDDSRPSSKDVKEPEPWLGKTSDWRKKKREFLAFLGKRRGKGNIPLVYLVRDTDAEDDLPDGDLNLFDQSNLALIRNAPLLGQAFESDNYDLYQFLVTWTSGGTAESYVDRFKSTLDGRSAWQRLLLAMEGTDARNSCIQAAEEMLDSAYWDRDRQNFVLDDYCNRHIRANLELEDLNAGRDGASQVRRFLQGIKSDLMRGLKFTILNDPECKTDLQMAVIRVKDLWNQTNPASSRNAITPGCGHPREQRNIGYQS
jgi:hypothetical protein